jgi:hypothetical protein
MDDGRVKMWPAATTYTIYVQAPSSVFSDPELASAQVSTDSFGLPLSASGQNAVVFRLRTGEADLALRCFISAPDEGAARYHALQQYLAAHSCPSVVAARWLRDGIRLGDDWWPVVVMPWVQGVPLNVALDDLRHQPTQLRRLADNWRRTCTELQQTGIAHGDLQHGNVLVLSDLALRLVDLDGVWVPDMGVPAPRETGHPNYQHPGRTPDRWGPNIDTFSAVLIDLSIRAIAADPTLYDEFAFGENLIFVRNDLEQPGRTPVWQRLAALHDPDVRELTAKLEQWCADADLPDVALSPRQAADRRPLTPPPPDIRTLVAPGQTTPALAAEEPWWEQRPTAADGPAAAGAPEPTKLSEPPSTPPVAAGPGLAPTPARPTEPVSPAKEGRAIGIAKLGANAAVAGLVGGAIAGVLGSVIQGLLYPAIDGKYESAWFVAFIAAFLGAALYGWQSVVGGHGRAGAARLAIGGLVGAAAGLVALVPADLIVDKLIDVSEKSVSSPGTVSLAWAIVAALVGLAVGLLRSARAAFSGLIAGAVAGAVAGLIFGSVAKFRDGGLVVDGKRPVVLLSAALVAGLVGLTIGALERRVRRGSLTVIEGRSRGIETLITASTATIGSSTRSTLVLSNDAAVQPSHAVITYGSHGPQIEAIGPVIMNGRGITGPEPLADGAVLQIGGSFVRFETNA